MGIGNGDGERIENADLLDDIRLHTKESAPYIFAGDVFVNCMNF
jgi:hypothetical protein